MPQLNRQEWDDFISLHPEAHILQTTAWGDLKSKFDWEVIRIQCGDVGAQLLIRRLALGYSIGYIPKGPIGADQLFSKSGDDDVINSDEPIGLLMGEIDALCRSRRCVFLKIEPDVWEITPDIQTQEVPIGFLSSKHAIQPPRTVVIDIRGDDDQILARMKQKTRYNIRLAMKKGVHVYPSADINIFRSILDITSQRDGFGVHSNDYYQQAYNLFHPSGNCELFMAEHDGQPLAGIMVFSFGKRAWYFYGGSSEIKRDLMPNYLLQWEAIRWARHRACTEYDLWGIPDYDEKTLEENFLKRSDGLWGVYRFKRGFGGKLLRSLGPYDRVYNRLIYRLYGWVKRGAG